MKTCAITYDPLCVMREVHAVIVFCIIVAATHAESNRDIVRSELSESSIGFDDDQNFYLVYSRGWDTFFDALYVLFNVSNIGSFMGGSQMTTAGSRVGTAILPVVVGSSLLLGLCVRMYRHKDRQSTPVADQDDGAGYDNTDRRSLEAPNRAPANKNADRAARDYRVDMKITFLDNQETTFRHDNAVSLIISPLVHLLNATYVYATVGLVSVLLVGRVYKSTETEQKADAYWLWLWLDASVLDTRDLYRLRMNVHLGLLLFVRIVQAIFAPILWVYGAIIFGFHLFVLGLAYTQGKRGQIEWFPQMRGPVASTSDLLFEEVDLNPASAEVVPLATRDRL